MRFWLITALVSVVIALAVFVFAVREAPESFAVSVSIPASREIIDIGLDGKVARVIASPGCGFYRGGLYRIDNRGVVISEDTTHCTVQRLEVK